MSCGNKFACLLLDQRRRRADLSEDITVCGILYTLFPIDLIADVVPVLGQLDDLTILLIGAKVFIEMAPPQVVARYMAQMNPQKSATVVEGETVDLSPKVKLIEVKRPMIQWISRANRARRRVFPSLGQVAQSGDNSQSPPIKYINSVELQQQASSAMRQPAVISMIRPFLFFWGGGMAGVGRHDRRWFGAPP